MYVKDIMVTDIASIDEDRSIYDACKVFRVLKVGSVLIKNATGFVGIVTERDLIERAMLQFVDIKNTQIKEIMSTDLKTVEPHDKVERALEMMKEHNIKKLPVKQRGEVVGIITLSDIAHSRPSVKSFIQHHKASFS